MKKYKVEIVGVTPYMQHRMDEVSLEEWEKKRGKIIERKDVEKEDVVRANFHMFRDEKGKPYLPAEHIRGALINAGAFVKAKVGNSKRSMKNIVAAMFDVKPDKINCLPETWTIDKRTAFNRSVKARIIVIRPKWNDWKANFEVLVDNDTITDATVRDILDYAGKYCGIGSFNPIHTGKFGRFKVTQFDRLK